MGQSFVLPGERGVDGNASAGRAPGNRDHRSRLRVDSIPAAFGITNDVFVIFTANAFAVLGLRALYFVLAGAMDRFTYVNFGLATLLVFIGCKMLLEPFLTVPILASVAVIVVVIGASIVASLWHERRADPVSIEPKESSGVAS